MLCPWITSSTSNLLKRLKTQKDIPTQKRTNYRKLKVTQLEKRVTEKCQNDRKTYQEALVITRNTDAVFKHLKSLNGSSAIPEEITWGERLCKDNQHKTDLLNEFFYSVVSLKIEINLRV